MNLFVQNIADGYSTDSLQFRWSDSPVKVAEGLNFPQFELKENHYYECNKDYYGSKHEISYFYSA